jgi:hypothetical protein
MSSVLTCPRCLQSSSLVDGATPPSICPFCRYEGEMPIKPATHIVGGPHPCRQPGRWQAVMLAGVMFGIPTSLFTVLVARSHAPAERVIDGVAVRPATDARLPAPVRKPELVVSGIVVETSPVIVDRRYVPQNRPASSNDPEAAPVPKEHSTVRAVATRPVSARSQCLQCHNTHTLAVRRELNIASPGIFFAERLDAAKVCPALDGDDAELISKKN